jgi:hypothetical protein
VCGASQPCKGASSGVYGLPFFFQKKKKKNGNGRSIGSSAKRHCWPTTRADARPADPLLATKRPELPPLFHDGKYTLHEKGVSFATD